MPRKTVKYLPVVCAVMVLILLAYMYTGSVGEFKSSDFRLRSAESTDYRTILERLNNNDKVAQDDPRLIKVIREYYIEPPSRLPYNLEDENIQDYSQAGQSQVVDKLLNKQVPLSNRNKFHMYIFTFSFGATIEGKNLLPGSKFFPLKVAQISRVVSNTVEATSCLLKLSPFTKWRQNLFCLI